MILRPTSRDELAAQLAAFAAGEKIDRVELENLSALVEHTPEDMTATVEGGMKLQAFHETLRLSGQWLPLDPPHSENLTIADLLAFDLSGSRRFGYGTARDYLIGIKVALPYGEIIKAGGKVVKNVAGYDLCKLFVGARHSLGIIVEATFKLRPLPEVETFMQAEVSSLDEVKQLRDTLLATAAEPVLFDANAADGTLAVTLAFAGMREDVEAQVAIARGVGFSAGNEPQFYQSLWSGAPPRKTSVLPSRTVEALKSISPSEFLAHLGNGIIYFRGGTPPADPPVPLNLMARVKMAYDPKNIFPAYA